MTKALALAATASLLVLALLGSTMALAAKPAGPGQWLRALVRQTAGLPHAAAGAKQRRKLAHLAAHARRALRSRPCTAVKDLERFRRVLKGVKVKKGRRYQRAGNRLAALGATSMQGSRRLLASKRTKRCGGGVKPNSASRSKFRILKSNAKGMRLRVQLPALRFVAQTGGGKSWTQLVLPNTDAPGKPGSPGIPVANSIIGVPDGASVAVKTGHTTSYTVGGVNVFPVQPDPVDQDTPPPNIFKPPFADPPFTLNRDAYANDGPIPAKPADGDLIGSARDLNIGSVQIPAAQYNPKTDSLKVFNTVDVIVNFRGGPHTFSDELGSPWEQPQRRLIASLLNFKVVRPELFELIRRCGEEMLVITNPATRAAADQFATARRGAGYRTNVFETGTGPAQIGTTAAQIQTFIRDRLTQLGCMHPSYVTIMGDDELVPTFTTVRSTIPSDLPYAKKNDLDDLPDVALGRILGNGQAQVSTAVTKIVNYETTPLSGPILTRALMAAQFQDDNGDGREERTFITFAEAVRNGLKRRGVAVDRIYQDAPASTPLKFNDGTDLPADLKKPTFAWNGTGADVTTAWNEGRFLVMHRDHGYADGWTHPGFTTTNAEALTNGSQLPVVMSINCSSAAYDYDDTSFTQQALTKSNGGAVGVFGDTRDSPTWHNTQLALGFVDGLLPSVLSAEGPAFPQRVGDALINGKLRLAGLAPPASDGSTVDELYLWHYFGDPSMQMWGGGHDPFHIDLSQILAVFAKAPVGPGPDPPPYGVVVTLPAQFAGQAISLLRNGQVVGKAVIGADGKVTIPASFGDGSPKSGELEVAMEADGAEPIRVPVQEAQTTLTQTCPADLFYSSNALVAVTGNLAGAPAGSTVDVTWDVPDMNEPGRTVVTHPTTDAQGNWSTSVQSGSNEWGAWTVSSKYAGSAGYKPSQAGPCTFVVDNDS